MTVRNVSPCLHLGFLFPVLLQSSADLHGGNTCGGFASFQASIPSGSDSPKPWSSSYVHYWHLGQGHEIISSSHPSWKGAPVSMACFLSFFNIAVCLLSFFMLKHHLRLGDSQSSGGWEVKVRKTMAKRGKEGQEDRRNPVSQCPFRETSAPHNISTSHCLYLLTLPHWKFHFQYINSGDTFKP